MSTIEGMVLAAGYGRRLFPLTALRAKPSIPFLNRPLLRYSLDLLEQSGISLIHVNLHHLPESVREAVRTSRMAIRYWPEQEILGTAGGIANAVKHSQADTLVVSNGKIYFELDLTQALDSHFRRRAWVTLVVVPFREGGYNPVYLDEEGRVTGFGRPAPDKGKQHPYVFSGVQILDRKYVENIPEGFSDTVKDILPGLIESGRPIYGHVSRDYWCECSLPQRYLRRSLEVLGRRGLDTLGPMGEAARARAVVAASDARIGSGCLLQECILWSDVQVGRGCNLERVVAACGVRLAAGSRLSDVIVTPRLEELPPGRRPLQEVDGNMIWPLET
ncbi:MAG TPA: NDP-sugar synthase [Acidobacteriota bacterium]|nr:NDP-sugar synthase [Acidobacteriota bacterium]